MCGVTIYDFLNCDIIPASLQRYYKEATGAFVVFDVTRLSTFEAVRMWKADLDNKVRLPNGKPLPTILLANKVRGRGDILSKCYLFPVNSVI